MEYWLPVFFIFAMGLSMLIYVLLDGYDLGVGLLLPFAKNQERDMMIASIGPFWDANETWLVLGIGVLLIAFPQAHGMILTALYIPVAIMLFGLILRGVAFDFRVKAGDSKKQMWDRFFFLGSFVTSTAQGWMLGDYITGLQDTKNSFIFSSLIAITLPAFYIMLGAAWLMIKTEGELFDKAVRWAKKSILPMGFALLLISIATPIVSETIADKWFVLPNTIGLLPIPLSCLIVYGGIIWLLNSPQVLAAGYYRLVYFGLVVICFMAAIGLGYSVFPEIVIGQLNIWQAAAATGSLKMIFYGTVITLPAILAYTVFIHWVFRGKATHLSYE